MLTKLRNSTLARGCKAAPIDDNNELDPLAVDFQIAAIAKDDDGSPSLGRARSMLDAPQRGVVRFQNLRPPTTSYAFLPQQVPSHGVLDKSPNHDDGGGLTILLRVTSPMFAWHIALAVAVDIAGMGRLGVWAEGRGCELVVVEKKE
ncbi:hypothetical protein BJ912DRAFT_1056331 [Pholiota molesta]|nr:hypothetical protein BJ912DRAFT_1056331 [Pholiota molesta]